MASSCHMCGSEVVLTGAEDESKGGFECADCGEVTCNGCKSIGVAKQSDHCRRCRG